MFMVLARLRNIEMNKLNIKTEIKMASQIWSIFSIFYFICNQMYGSKSKNTDGKVYQYLILFGILMRNLGVFLA